MNKGILLLAGFIALPVSATQLTYEPINPSFGGNPLNGNFLLGKAQSQNDHTKEYTEQTFTEKFQESLERNLLYSLTSSISNGEFTSGTYNTGNHIVEVVDDNPNEIKVIITDIATGEVTEIIMPKVPF
ncbi:curli assembly protein CsgF [Ferrimonas marina]|uniref:Curli production assembly/transport component CsgF n=1 Tax=Ferrimonas marina TaxID=299255 RepID=A0A1M5VR50_9GAMM|nr:curli assembly protein CsgF [Ferrimonas marina]SHH77403.1 curli production assembly/transport component CsgF [Ferrimonas marina]